ncbi:beta/gamma crystallin domain-containing protein [Streptomyces sp. NPDC004539]|uniref:beta/gamma crystallin domain-containing protein n=1 Tax=Streptomyces sp. NPDC004539 TaxID=3154280 RepID=UPI0033A3C80E
MRGVMMAAAASALAMGGVLGAAGQAAAIKQINFLTCQFSSKYLTFTVEQKSLGGRPNYYQVCYADAGYTKVNIQKVVSVSAGNNSGNYVCTIGKKSWVLPFKKGESDTFRDYCTIKFITIF